MSWKQSLSVVMIVGTLALSLTGCRNRCGQSCGAPFQQQPYYGQPAQQPIYGQPPQQPYVNPQFQNPGYNAPVFNGSTSFNTSTFNNGPASRSPLIPPPATGSLTIPSIARNNPFGVNQNRGLLNTNQAAPTPANNRSARVNAQNGWQGIDSASSSQSTLTTQPAGSTSLSSNSATSGASSSVPAVPASASSVLVANANTNASAAARGNQGYGASYLRSPDYQTTTINETRDGTRLPATDASGIRAPSQYYARATGVQLARVPQQPYVGAAQPYYSGTFRTAAAPYPVAGVQSGVFAANTNAVVLDQGTATYDPYGDTRSADWRNRDTSGSFQ